MELAQSEEAEYKILSLMLTDHSICEVLATSLKPEYFSNKATSWLFRKMAGAKVRLTPLTLREEFIRAAKSKEIDEDEVPKFTQAYDQVKEPPVLAEREYLISHLTDFIRHRAFLTVIQNSPDLILAQDYDALVSRIMDANVQGLDILDVGYDYFDDLEDRLTRRISREAKRKVSTGVPSLDELLYGGLSNKQVGLIVGATGRGKSLFLQWLARAAILCGKKVVYYTFELSDEDIMARFDSMFSHVKVHELPHKTADVMNEIGVLKSTYGTGVFRVKEYPQGKITVPVLESHLQQLASQGFVPDVICIDYLDLLKSVQNYSNKWDNLEDITIALGALAKSLDTRIWTATQMNRAGLGSQNRNEGVDESMIAGAVSKLYNVDVAVLMEQSPSDREDELMKLQVSKNRNGPAGRTVQIDTDYAFMSFFRPPPETDNDESSEV